MVGSVEPDDVGRAALVQDSQLRHDLLLDGRLHLQVDHLLCHDHSGRLVTDAVNDACKGLANLVMSPNRFVSSATQLKVSFSDSKPMGSLHR